MPFPLIPVIGAAASLLGGAMSSASQGKLNRRTMRYNTYMYDRQRKDALADYYMQTEYNSPVAQMQRLRDAKLNPNLVYGDGVTQNAPSVRSSSGGSWSPTAPRSGEGLQRAGGDLQSYYDIKLKEAQTNNVMMATTVLEDERTLKRAQAYAAIKGAGKTDLESQELMVRLSRAQELVDTSVDAAKMGVEKQKAEVYTMLSRNEREIAMNSVSLKEAATRILKMRAEISKVPLEKKELQQRIYNLEISEELDNEDLKLKRQGVQPHDALWQRRLIDIINDKSGSIRRGIRNTLPFLKSATEP